MGFMDSISNASAQVFGNESAAETERKEQTEAAEQAQQQRMNQLEQQNAQFKDGVSGYDQPGISQCVNWDGFSHADIFQKNQDSIDSGRAGEVAAAWCKLGESLRDRGPDFSKRLNDAIGGGWEGEAADKAKQVSKPVEDWMVGSGNAFEWTGNNMQTAGDSAGEAKKMVGEPENFSGWKAGLKMAVSPPVAGVDELGKMEEREQAEKAARETMGRVYSPSLTEVDQQMPKFQKPDGTDAEPPPPQPHPETPWGGGGGATQPSATGPAGVGDGMPGGAGNPGAAGDRVPGGGVPGGGASTPGSGTPGATSPHSSAPVTAATAGAPGGGPGGATPGGGPGGGPGGAPGGGAGGMVGGGPGGAAGGGAGPGGRAGVGSPGSGNAGGGAAARGGGAGRAGGPMGGMGGGRGGQGQGEDDEHERPSWLEENDDVWFNDMPRTAPPVLGE